MRYKMCIRDSLDAVRVCVIEQIAPFGLEAELGEGVELGTPREPLVGEYRDIVTAQLFRPLMAR